MQDREQRMLKVQVSVFVKLKKKEFHSRRPMKESEDGIELDWTGYPKEQ